MTNDTAQNSSTEKILQGRLGVYVKLIEKLAGEKSNLKISFQGVSLNIDKTKLNLSGEVNLDFVNVNKVET